MSIDNLKLKSVPGRFAVVHLPLESAQLPQFPSDEVYWSITRTAVEYSIVCRENVLKLFSHAQQRVDQAWSAFYLAGPIPFSLTGIIAQLTAPLGQAGIGCFVVSTFDSDLIMVKVEDRDRSLQAWNKAGILLVD